MERASPFSWQHNRNSVLSVTYHPAWMFCRNSVCIWNLTAPRFELSGTFLFKRIFSGVEGLRSSSTMHKLMERWASPHPQRQQGSSWTSHKPARIKCSPRSPQISRRPTEGEKKKQYEHTHIRTPQGIKTKKLLAYTAHSKMVDTAGILQQLLKWNSPAQDAVGGARVSARSAWKTGVIPSTTSPCRQVQRCTTTGREEHRSETHTHRFTLKHTLPLGKMRFFRFTSVWHCLALWTERDVTGGKVASL